MKRLRVCMIVLLIVCVVPIQIGTALAQPLSIDNGMEAEQIAPDLIETEKEALLPEGTLGQPSISVEDEFEEEVPFTPFKNEKEAIDFLLNGIDQEAAKDALGLTTVDRNNIRIGEKIPIYTVASDINIQQGVKIIENPAIKYIPIYDNNTIIATICITNANTNDPSYALSSLYAKELDIFKNTSSEVAFLQIDDKITLINESYYLVEDQIITSDIQENTLKSRSDDIEGDDLITHASDLVEPANIAATVRAEPSYGSNDTTIKNPSRLPEKKQDNTLLCWAATVAAIGEYKTGVSKTSLVVAQESGVTGNTAMLPTFAASSLATSFGWGNSRVGATGNLVGTYSDTVMKRHIQNYQPFAAGFTAPGFLNWSYGHLMTVYGYRLNNSGAVAGLWVMSPGTNGGKKYLITKNTYNRWAFTWPTSGNTVTWDEAGGGFVLTGWQKFDSGWWYMNSSGGYNIGWIDNKYFCDYSTGKMAINQWVFDTYWYFVGPSGAKYVGQWLYDGAWYYLKASTGRMAANETIYINGKYYTFNASGVCTNP